MTDVIGTRVIREDAWAKAFGQAKFPADENLPGQLYGAVVRSPHPHALIREIDLAKAKTLPGVVCIATAADLVHNSHGVLFRDQPVLVDNRIRMVGDPIIAIAAENPVAAREAALSVRIEYELLEPSFNPEEAMKPGASPLHPEIHGPSNIIYHLPIIRGEAEKAFALADVVIEKDYSTQMVDHAFLQPEAVLAHVDERGHVVVQVATQYPHYDRGEIAHALGIKVSRVQVKSMSVGGAFGGREDISLQIIAAVLAYKTHRPVKLENTRQESFYSHCKRHPMTLHYKTGATKDGKLVALEARLVGDAGAYASWSPNILRKAAVHATGPYEIPNVKIDAYAVLTNNPWTGAMRGFGAIQPVLAYESQMDLLAQALGLSPLEIRLRNVFRPGGVTATGQGLGSRIGLGPCLEHISAYLEGKEGQA